MVWLSILLVGACAICWDLGVVLQKRAADRLPPLEVGRGTLAAAARLLKSPQWMGGLLISAAGWGLFTSALTFTPVSLARSVQGIGFVALAVMSVFLLDHRLSRREWAGVAAVTAGVLLLGFSEPLEKPPDQALDLLHLGVGVAAALGVCALLEVGRRAVGGGANVGGISGVAGILLGLGDVLTRAVIVESSTSKLVAFGVLGPVLVVCYLSGVFTLTRAYQHGRAIVVTGVSDLAARLVTLFVGVLALDEALPEEPLHKLGRLAGFALVLAGTVALAQFSAEDLAAKRTARLAQSPPA